MKRTEEDGLSMQPIRVRFGIKDYDIKCLGINAQRKWRTQLAEQLGPIVESFNQKADQNAVMLGLAGALQDFPEKLTDLVFAYGSELPKDTIMEEATEEQISVAFSQIMGVAFPFLAQLGLVTTVIRSQRTPSAK